MNIYRSLAWLPLAAAAVVVSGQEVGPAPGVGEPKGVAPSQAPSVAVSPAGAIAYVRGGREIRLIAPDGTGDRRLWDDVRATKDLGINGLAWRPDGKELAFASGHASATSLYHADLYAVRPDGSGFRKITNPPDASEFGRYKKGTVVVPLRNSQVFFRNAQASSGVFMVYVAGAAAPQRVVLPVGSAKTLTFRNVADFGKVAQPVVAIFGRFRWFIPGVDVRAGQNVRSTELTISGDGFELFGAFRPVWRSDGSRISYRDGFCIIKSVPARPPDGEHLFQPLFAGKNPLGACTWDWGPTRSTADKVLYTENASGGSSIYLVREGGRHPGTKLTTFTDVEYQMLLDLRWLPDGSGFLYANKTLFADAANIFRFDLATKKLTQVTRLEKEFARSFSVSPDGRWVVFERGRSADEDAPADLWVVGTDGSEPRLLVKDGLRPAWGRPSPTTP